MKSITRNWKKRAASAAIAADVEAIEKAFMDQAYTFVANKSGALMQDPYRLGFEVVYKNEDNTRMVGIFAFRVNDELLYVPCFFLNGEIKGTDLLYRHGPKKFVPNNREWVSFLLEKAEVAEGRGINKDHRRKMPVDVNIEDIARPPSRGGRGIGKYASVDGAPELNEDFLNKMAGSPVKKFNPILKRFLRENGMEAFDKLVSWVDQSPNFAKALVDNVNESEFLLDDLEHTYKQAAAPGGSLRLVVGELPEEGVKSASAEDFFKRGFTLLDDRSKDLTPIFQDESEQFQGISEAGIYDIIMGDGTIAEAFVASGDQIHIPMSGYPTSCGRSYDGHFDNFDNNSIVVLKSDKSSGRCQDVMGLQKMDFHTALRDGSMLRKTMSKGKIYRILDVNSGTLTEPVYCCETKSSRGMKVYKICTDYEDPVSLKVNPDYYGFDLEAMVIGANNRFIEVAGDVETLEHSPNQYRIRIKLINNVGNSKHLVMRLCEEGYKRASVKKVSEHFYRIDTGSKYLANELGFKSACVALSKDLAIPGELALAVMDKVAAEGRYDFFLQPQGEKAASVIRVLDEPDFDTEYDNDYGVALDPARSYVLDTEEEFEDVPEQRVGDAMDPRFPGGTPSVNGIPQEMIRNAPPEALAQYARLNNLPNVFEHGLVGSLVQTYDSVAMLDKYIPEIESALDGVGRILFLFWWKPGDFQKAYGTDDMAHMENQLISNFKSTGELTLNLLKRSKQRLDGTPPL